MHIEFDLFFIGLKVKFNKAIAFLVDWATNWRSKFIVLGQELRIWAKQTIEDINTFFKNVLTLDFVDFFTEHIIQMVKDLGPKILDALSSIAIKVKKGVMDILSRPLRAIQNIGNVLKKNSPKQLALLSETTTGTINFLKPTLLIIFPTGIDSIKCMKL